MQIHQIYWSSQGKGPFVSLCSLLSVKNMDMDVLSRTLKVI